MADRGLRHLGLSRPGGGILALPAARARHDVGHDALSVDDAERRAHLGARGQVERCRRRAVEHDAGVGIDTENAGIGVEAQLGVGGGLHVAFDVRGSGLRPLYVDTAARCSRFGAVSGERHEQCRRADDDDVAHG